MTTLLMLLPSDRVGRLSTRQAQPADLRQLQKAATAAAAAAAALQQNQPTQQQQQRASRMPKQSSIPHLILL
jgi:hypothetical protein